MIKNQKGFTAFEAVLILIVVVLLAGAGWYVYRANKDDKKQATSSQNEQKSTDSKQTEAKNEEQPAAEKKTYVMIKEWNIRAEYTGDQKLLYKVVNDKGARFSSDQLEKYGSGCMVDDSPAGIIERLKPTDGTDFDGGGATAAEAAKTNSSIVKVGDYYYRFLRPQAACGDPNAPASLQEAAIKAVSDLVPKLTVVQ